jgi:hypothetical protein
MTSEHEPSSPESQSSQQSDDDGFQRAKNLDPGTPMPDEEIQVNLKKFAIVLGGILLFAVVGAMFTQLVGGK